MLANNISRTTTQSFFTVCRRYSTQKMTSHGTIVPKIAPSMLSSDFARLAEEAQRMLDNGADYLHMDVMVCAACIAE